MARKADRVGVRKDQVDIYGRPIAQDFYENLIQDLPSWTDMSVWVGGTEQLLPENDDEPETTPILANIEYPDGLLENQYFTYRKSPTEEDGLAKIRGIKGNTIIWNQKLKELNSTNWRNESDVTITFSNNEAVVSCSSSASNGMISSSRIDIIANHKYFVSVDVMSSNEYENIKFGMQTASGIGMINVSNVGKTNEWIKTTRIGNGGTTGGYSFYCYRSSGNYSDIHFKNLMFIDLTSIFGSTLADQIYAMEQATAGSGVAYFKSLFPLDYYAYDTGRLLSFTGTGLKTVGFNQWDEEWEVGGIKGVDGQNENASDRIRSKNYIHVLPSTNYYYQIPVGNMSLYYYDADKNYITYADFSPVHSFTTPSNCYYIRFKTGATYGTTYKDDICINFSSSRNGEYEPYVTHTTELPISTFFPTGMKSAGNAYDELLSNRAITRIGADDLETLTFEYIETYSCWRCIELANIVKKYSQQSEMINCVAQNYELDTNGVLSDASFKDGMFILGTSGNLFIKNGSDTVKPTGYFFYELATPVVQPTLVFE